MAGRVNRSLLATILVFLALYTAAAMAYDGFASWFQLCSLFSDNAPLGLAALGMTFVIISGGIDLSVGSLLALSSLSFAVMIENWELPPSVGIALALGLGCGFGALQGSIIHAFALPPFLVTLSGLFLARGCALVIVEGKRLAITDTSIYAAASGFELFGLPVPALVFLAAFAFMIPLGRGTRFGRAVYALGGDETSAFLMGVPVSSTKIRVYALSGVLTATAGVVHALGTGAGDATIAHLLELDAIAAVVIGGTLLSGGVGSPVGTLLGVLILGLIATIPSYQGNLNSWWTRIATAGLLLAFVALQRFLQRERGRRWTGEPQNKRV